jgi:hypothetical protein
MWVGDRGLEQGVWVGRNEVVRFLQRNVMGRKPVRSSRGGEAEGENPEQRTK